MSDTDKTGKRLVDSIRKTKAGSATAAAQSAKDDTAAKPAASKPATAATKKTPASTPRRAATRKTPAKTKSSTEKQDPFQAARRIWPD